MVKGSLMKQYKQWSPSPNASSRSWAELSSSAWLQDQSKVRVHKLKATLLGASQLYIDGYGIDHVYRIPLYIVCPINMGWDYILGFFSWSSLFFMVFAGFWWVLEFGSFMCVVFAGFWCWNFSFAWYLQGLRVWMFFVLRGICTIGAFGSLICVVLALWKCLDVHRPGTLLWPASQSLSGFFS